jgi:hypothetical protein
LKTQRKRPQSGLEAGHSDSGSNKRRKYLDSRELIRKKEPKKYECGVLNNEAQYPHVSKMLDWAKGFRKKLSLPLPWRFSRQQQNALLSTLISGGRYAGKENA